MRLVWEEDALGDLDAIEAYIARDNPRTGATVRERIMDRVEQLAHSPGIGRPGRVHNTRELVIAGLPYIVAYTVSNEMVRVLAVLHGAQQWPESF